MLFREINNSNYHIVCFEDIDRCELLVNSSESNEVSNGLKTLLNELDGINEAYKRITIFTANDKSKIESIDALCRPGRIDKIIEISNCNAKQLNDIFNHYTDSQTKLELKELDFAISPANAIKLILVDTMITAEQYIEKLEQYKKSVVK